MKNIILSAAAFVSITAQSAAALPPVSVFQTGNTLLALCSGVQIEKSACFSYLMAVADVLQSGAAFNGYRACIPTGVTGSQLGAVYVKHLTDYPNKRQLTAVSPAAEAFDIAFPCK